MSDLYAQGLAGPARPLTPGERLPGVGSLSPAQHALLRLDQIDADVASLRSTIEAHGLPLPSAAELRSAQEDADVGAQEREQQILTLHLKLLRTLTAVDYRLGKAYGLGRALADTCRPPASCAELARHFGHYRLDNLRGWLNDLATALPDHSARGTLSGLARWEAWAANLRAAPGVEAEWAQLQEPIRATVRRQGELWRAVLTGAKNARDMLSTDSYLQGADAMVGRAGALAWRFLRRPALSGPLLAAIVGALGLLIWAIASGGAAQVAAGIASVAAALGITWKTVGVTAQKLGEALEEPLWGAEIDAAVGEAMTYLPLGPVREPRADIMLAAPWVLSALDRGAPVKTAGEREARDYLHAWARAAGYIEVEQDAEGNRRERLSGEGRRLSAIPTGEQGRLSAALGAGRSVGPEADGQADPRPPQADPRPPQGDPRPPQGDGKLPAGAAEGRAVTRGDGGGSA